MRRIIIVLVFAGSAFYLSAGTLDDIDQAVEQLGRFVTRLIPDESNQTIIITPFLSDQSGRNLLGDRLKSELELFLAGVFVNTRIIDQPENLNTYSITGEINPVALEIFSLPNMERVKGRTESLFFLSTGDYLLALKNEVPERIRMCVAPEGTAGDCLSSSKE